MSSSPTFASGISDDLLDKLYSTPTSTSIPGFLWTTHESTHAVLEILRHDFKRHSPFLNHFKFHNHSSHHVLAVYALGASPEFIRDVYYKKHLPKLLPTSVSPGHITEENFVEHLNDEKYYDAYLAFFTAYLQSHSSAEALERFVFSPAYNFKADFASDGRDSKDNVQPQMLNRLLAGLLHPFIQLAYGLEFGILGQIAEGLAQAAVHGTDQTELIPPSYFTKPETDTTSADLSDSMRHLEISGSSTSQFASAPEKRPTFAFHRRILDDPAFTVELPSSAVLHYETVVKTAGSAIHDLVRGWTEEWLAGVGTRADAEVRLKGMVEEVVWGNVIWYVIGGWASRGTEGRGFNADFFVAHLVTSAAFLPKIVLKDESSSASCDSSTTGLSFASRLLLLQTYLSVSTTMYIMRGRHTLPIVEFYAATDAQVSAAPGSAWARVIQSAIQFPDEHGPKIARALADFAARWGTRAPGYFSAAGEEGGCTGAPLEGIERLDGTLFVRVAGLTFDRLGWVGEGEKAGLWDWDGFPMLEFYATIKGAS
ncbi:hypothetical protein EI94DRAFT_1706802 [Lactarius quietus]|nr:hypothetical protein EI94DRAFT_1706802 [Lactarius quietus]